MPRNFVPFVHFFLPASQETCTFFHSYWSVTLAHFLLSYGQSKASFVLNPVVISLKVTRDPERNKLDPRTTNEEGRKRCGRVTGPFTYLRATKKFFVILDGQGAREQEQQVQVVRRRRRRATVRVLRQRWSGGQCECVRKPRGPSWGGEIARPGKEEERMPRGGGGGGGGLD